MNKRNFGRVIKRIEAHPELYDQTIYPIERHPCGTPYCFAGHAEMLRTGGKSAVTRAFWPEESRVLQKFLGLTKTDLDMVFAASASLVEIKRWHKAGKVS